MTEITPDQFERLGRELVAGASRDLCHSRRRSRLTGGAFIAMVSLFLITGIATAANNDIARSVRSVPGGAVFDVFNGGPSRQVPSVASEATITHMDQVTDQMHPDDPQAAANGVKVLLQRNVNGVDVEIVATRRQGASANSPETTCYSATTDGHSNGYTCTPEMMPGMPVNYSTAYEQTGAKATAQEIVGITDSTVERVDVRTDRRTTPAAMGERAFWWRAALGETADRLVIHLKSGEVVSADL